MLAFGLGHFGNVDVKIPDRLGIELLFRRLVAINIGQSTDAVTREASKQRWTGQVRKYWLEDAEAIAQGQERLKAE